MKVPIVKGMPIENIMVTSLVSFIKVSSLSKVSISKRCVLLLKKN
jgi:hypothetical protein